VEKVRQSVRAFVKNAHQRKPPRWETIVPSELAAAVVEKLEPKRKRKRTLVREREETNAKRITLEQQVADAKTEFEIEKNKLKTEVSTHQEKVREWERRMSKITSWMKQCPSLFAKDSKEEETPELPAVSPVGTGSQDKTPENNMTCETTAAPFPIPMSSLNASVL
jgi:hypothetical protein